MNWWLVTKKYLFSIQQGSAKNVSQSWLLMNHWLVTVSVDATSNGIDFQLFVLTIWNVVESNSCQTYVEYLGGTI